MSRLTKQRARLDRFIAKWEPMLDLPGIYVTNKVLDTRADDDATTCATTEAKWNYRWATIVWYAPVMAGIEDDELEAIVVHEYCHVLLCVLDDQLSGDEAAPFCEAATENVARALLGVYSSASKA